MQIHCFTGTFSAKRLLPRLHTFTSSRPVSDSKKERKLMCQKDVVQTRVKRVSDYFPLDRSGPRGCPDGTTGKTGRSVQHTTNEGGERGTGLCGFSVPGTSGVRGKDK